ncbi:MAG TPA: hypothetical protein PK431_15205 [Chitinophagales bacterium]|nr:hypothetical protein [Chitinophagales bacterium]
MKKFGEKQHYFPYFFYSKELESALKKLGNYKIEIQLSSKTQIAETLLIKQRNENVSINIWERFFISKNGKLIKWKSDEHEKLFFTITDLKNLHKLLEFTLDIGLLNYGENKYQFPDEFKNITEFVIFCRRNDLQYDLEYYEKYVIVTINPEEDKITIQKFDAFNIKGGDYGYVWPAVAQRELLTGDLYCKGMRMSDFIIKSNGEVISKIS